jgi:starch synthase
MDQKTSSPLMEPIAPARGGTGPQVLFAASEAYPLVKTGGLADVACYLSKALAEQGADARIVLPAYGAVLEQVTDALTLARLSVEGATSPVRLLQTMLPGTGVPVYLVDCPALYARPGNPYVQPDGTDWADNAARFALFSRVIALIATRRAGLDWAPEIVHCNDWHTGLAPALLASEPARPATVFVIHNLAFRGLFPAGTFPALALPARLWGADGLEFYGQLSFIKGGLVFADRLVAVSPGFARDILTPAGGHGMDGLLRARAGVLSGILNGVDYRVWDPRRDPFIASHYWLDALEGKRADKRALQQELGLFPSDGALLFGFIGRLADQKGVDLILAIVDDLMAHGDVQLALLGSGERFYEQELRRAAGRWHGRVGARIGYDEGLAHRLEAGVDCFLMPSREEPCGLNQLYSLRYGTVPIVRATGGLADTVIDADSPGATGFVFREAIPHAVYAACTRAREVFVRTPERWHALMQGGMRQDFGWERSARAYLDLYRSLIRERAPRACE